MGCQKDREAIRVKPDFSTRENPEWPSSLSYSLPLSISLSRWSESMARLTIMTTPFRPNYIPDTQIAPLFTSPLFSLATPHSSARGNLDGHNYTPALNLKLIKTVRKKKKKRLVILHHQENEAFPPPPPF